MASLTTSIFLFFGQDPTSSFLLGILVLSHWIIDFIVSPMTYAFPNDTGKLLYPFQNSPKVGLGVMKTKTGVIVVEGGSLLIGSIVFVSTLP